MFGGVVPHRLGDARPGAGQARRAQVGCPARTPAREIETATMAAARLFVDRRESALNEAGDVLIPMREGAFTADHIQAELGEVLIGKHPGRGSATEITLFKSLGIAVEDVAAAAYVARRANDTQTGQTVTM